MNKKEGCNGQYQYAMKTRIKRRKTKQSVEGETERLYKIGNTRI